MCLISSLFVKGGQQFAFEDVQQETKWWFQTFWIFTPKIRDMIEFDKYFSTEFETTNQERL